MGVRIPLLNVLTRGICILLIMLRSPCIFFNFSAIFHLIFIIIGLSWITFLFALITCFDLLKNSFFHSVHNPMLDYSISFIYVISLLLILSPILLNLLSCVMTDQISLFLHFNVVSYLL